MIDTMDHQKPFDAREAHQGRVRPHEVLYEETILTLTDSEYTSLADLRQPGGPTKRRKMQAGVTPRREMHLIHTGGAHSTSLCVPEEDYQRLRLKLVDSVAKAMKIEIDH